ncbi:hypothetical protein [Streptomyces nitrosporeus]|uniref:hypothetical protein n=1 Tax=Streptomyces nitrosporeus TaxID=28894 RepID=UPI00399F1892
MWTSEEFGQEHADKPGVLLADGTEPGPVYFEAGSGATMHRSTDWWVYDGTVADRHHPYAYDTTGPEGDWDTHLAEVRARAVPVPADLATLIEQLGRQLTTLASEEPLAALRAATVLERLAATTATGAALRIDPDDAEWETIARALGVSEQTARARLTRYALRG